VSIHYTIGKDGKILKGVEERYWAWHTWRTHIHEDGTLYHNKNTIGIELNNIGDGSDQYPEEQIYATLKLVKAIRKRHGDIPCVYHKDINSNKIDPSENFSFYLFNSKYISMLTQKQLEQVEKDYTFMTIDAMRDKAEEWGDLEDFEKGLKVLTKPETFKDFKDAIVYGRLK